MPQVKELKELGVAGSATNEQGRYGSGMAPFVKSLSCLPIFVPVGRLLKKTVTGYKIVTEENCYKLHAKIVTG